MKFVWASTQTINRCSVLSKQRKIKNWLGLNPNNFAYNINISKYIHVMSKHVYI